MKWVYIFLTILSSVIFVLSSYYLISDGFSTPRVEREKLEQKLDTITSASLIENELGSNYTFFNEFDRIRFLFYEDGTVKVLDDIGEIKGEFSFSLTGNVNKENYIYNSKDTGWTWKYIEGYEQEDMTSDTPIEIPYYLLKGTNNGELNAVQEWKFYNNKSMKIKVITQNNKGEKIENTKFWFVNNLEMDETVNYDGVNYNVNADEDTLITSDLELKHPSIDTGFLEFNYPDVLSTADTSPLSDFYIGSGDIINQEGYITALSILVGTLDNKEKFIIDPEVTAYKSPTTTGSPLNQWTNGIRVKASDSSWATEATVGESLDTSVYTFDIPSGTTVVGIEVSVEGYGGICPE